MGSFKVKLVVYFLLLSLLPMVAAFWGFNAVAKRGETRRVDARLEGGLAAALAAFQDELEAAERDAATLAKNPGFQVALAVRDRAALQRIVRNSPNLRIEAGDGFGFRVGRVDPLAADRQVAVLVSGDLLGEVVASVPLDMSFLRRLRARSGLAPGDQMVILGEGTVAVGPRHIAGRIAAPPGRTTTATLGGVGYRALVATLVDELGASLAVLAPQARIDRVNEAAERRLFLGLLTALLLIALVAYVEGRSIVRTLRKLVGAANAIARGRLDERVPVRGRDEFALLGQAFNEMAGQLEARLAELEAGRRRLRDATVRFGEALAATHDTEQLLRVIVETAVESTGAAGGFVVGADGRIVQAGAPDAGAERIELPLSAGRESFGKLVLAGRTFTVEQLELAATLAGQAVIALDNARLHRIVERQALVDGLTGLANRRHAETALATEVARAQRFGGPLALVMADLDDFKAVNDRYGHAAGDGVLREFAASVQETVRDIDVAARWGGEEFAILLPGTDLAGGVRLAERIRRSLESRLILMPDGTPISMTASFGVAAFPEAATESRLTAAADAALYEAKRAGKNRVATAREPVPRP